MSTSYRTFFGMKKEAFSSDLSPKEIFETDDIRSVQQRFDYAVRLGAVALLTGEIGSGKSTALRYVAATLHPSEYRPIHITACSGSILEFYRLFLAELNIDKSSTSRAVMIRLIKKEIQELVLGKKLKVVLIVDEASLMRLEVFAELHTLTQFDGDSKPLLPLLLAGQNNLLDKLYWRTSLPLSSRVVARLVIARPVVARLVVEADRQRVHLALGASDVLRDRCCRIAGRRARSELDSQRLADVVVAGGAIVDRGTLEHEDVLAARAADVDRAQRAAYDLLVQLGELAGDHDEPIVAARRPQVVEGAQHAMGSLVDDRRTRFGGDVGEACGSLAALAGEEPLEHEPVGGEPADRERHHRRAGAGDGAHVVAGVDRRPHDALAGVGDPGRARIADDRDVSPVREDPEDVGDPAELGVVVAHREPIGLHPRVLQQQAGAPGVLAADQPDVGEHVDRAGRQVGEVADRSGDQPERAHDAEPSASFRRSSTSSPTCSPHRPNAPPSASITQLARHTGMPSRNRFMCIVLTTMPSLPT